MMTRCLFCGRIVWFWQRQGWLVGVARWHSKCWRGRGFYDDPNLPGNDR